MPVEPVPEPNDIETVVAARAGDTLGYARVSTNDQNLDAQRARLIAAGAIRVFTDIVSGKRFERPGLAELIDHARPGDGFGRSETHRGRIVTQPSRQTARNRQGNGLQNRKDDALKSKSRCFGPLDIMD